MRIRACLGFNRVLDASDEPGGARKTTMLAVGVLLLAACLFPASYTTAAQGVGASADLTGTVTDPTGAGVPNAKVTVTDPERGVQRAVMTDERGFYRVSGLAPSSYKVSVEDSGFQTEVAPALTLTVGQTLVFDFRLKLTGLPSQVEVPSAPPLVETERASQANTLTQDYIADLPIDRRDYLTFTLLAPGVSNATRLASDQDFRVKQTPQSGLSFYGSNGRGNSVTVDGGEANDDAGGVRLTLSQDAVQEVQVNRGNYAADLGGASGATINIVSKSGSNNLHANLFAYFRNDALDARDRFAMSQAIEPGDPFSLAATGVPIKNSLNRQQFGGNAGFPISKDKSFLYVAYEGLLSDAQDSVPLLTNSNIFAPTPTQQSIISGLAAEGATPVPCITTNPSNPLMNPLVLPASQCAFALGSILTVNPNPGPSPFVGNAQRALNPYIVNQVEVNGGFVPFPTHQHQFSARFDHQFGESD